MSEISEIISFTASSLQGLIKQAQTLAIGLENVALGNPTGGPKTSVSYLFSTAEQLTKIMEECNKLLENYQSPELPKKSY
jgi:hypothetical protein